MKGENVVESLNNAWKALVKIYDNNPSEDTRRALNLLSRIIKEVNTKSKKPKNEQITVDEWIAMLAK